MNLLPRTHHEFKEKEYWNRFFQKRSHVPFEWYGEYTELCEILHKYIKPKDDILVVGCGNSTISADMYKVGLDKITNIDISPVVIKQMNDLYENSCPNMTFLQMDATDMSFRDEHFSVILDKGTLDALMPDVAADTVRLVDKFFREISRVLKTGGRYICVTLLQEHILQKLLDRFAEPNFVLRVVKCHDVEEKSASLPVFIVVVTKFKQLPQTILEVSLVNGINKRLNSCDDVVSMINSYRQACMVTNGIQNNSLVDLETIELELLNPSDSSTRYTIYVLDQNISPSSGKFAAFLVPQGRETEWLFSTLQGRKELIKSIPFNRVAIFLLHRGQNYGSFEDVKKEITPYICHLISKKNEKHRSDNTQCPILSIGTDIGSREIICEGASEISGNYIVEEVEVNGDLFRRLIFLKTPSVIQSEAKVKNLKLRNGTVKKVIDHGYLASSYHNIMAVGCQLALSKKKNLQSTKILVIGLGGGSLCTFMNKTFEETVITAVDIDQEILKIAQEQFGLICNDKMKVVIIDGLQYLVNSCDKDEKYDSILFDVDSKDLSLGMSCPPKEFVDKNTLVNVSKCLSSEGLFILNLVCRDQNLRNQVLGALKSVFSSTASYKMEREVNEVLFCSNQIDVNWKRCLQSASESINSAMILKKLEVSELVDVEELISSLKIH